MMIVPKSDAVDPPRRSRGTAAFGGGSSGDAAAPSSGVSDAVVEPSALVELVGVTQTGTVLNQEQFLADVLRELKIIVWWNLTGTNSQRLEFFTPNGVLYKQFTSEFDADATRSPSSGLAPVEIRLPVGGTWITQYSLLGSWRVDVYLVGQRTRITSASFLLYR